MRYLYRYTCKPNYPVCTAEVLFQSYIAPTLNDSLLELARRLATEEGCSYAGEDENLYYFGLFVATSEYETEQVLSVVTGEY